MPYLRISFASKKFVHFYLKLISYIVLQFKILPIYVCNRKQCIRALVLNLNSQSDELDVGDMHTKGNITTQIAWMIIKDHKKMSRDC